MTRASLVLLPLAAALVLGAGVVVAAQRAPAAPPSPTTDLLSRHMDGPIDLIPKESAAALVSQMDRPLSNNRKAATDEQLDQLAAALDAGLYPQVSDFIRFHAGERKMIDWVELRAKNGNVPMMWDLADLYEFERNDAAVAKWANAAIIGTMQEATLCLDKQKNIDAPARFAALHPRSVKVARSTAHLSKEAKAFAFATLAAAQNYPSPALWLCGPAAGAAGRPQSAAKSRPLVYDAIYFPILRVRARNKLSQSLGVYREPEREPEMPTPPSPARLGSRR